MTINPLQLKNLFLIILLISGFGLQGYGQQNDAKLWAGFKLEKKFGKKINSSFEIEQRLNNNFSSFDRLLIEPKISYKLNKRWSLGLSYRPWIRRTTENIYSFKHRGNLSLSFRKNYKSFNLKLATGFQYGIPDLNQVNIVNTNNLVSRNSFRINYEIFGSRFSPFSKFELFTKLNRQQLKNYQWRISCGTNFQLNVSSSLRIFYAFEHEYNLDVPMNIHIWAFGYAYVL